MYCPHCGTEEPPDAAFCGQCGRALSQEEPDITLGPYRYATAPRPSSHSRPRRRLAIFVPLVALVLAAAGVGAYLSLRLSGPDIAGAKSAVQALESRSVELQLVGTQPYLGGTVERFSSSSASSGASIDYYYDPASGRVVRKDDFSPVAAASSVSPQQARSSAEDFARRNIPFFGQAGLALTGAVDAATNPSDPGQYSFTWTKTDPSSGAFLPTWLVVEVDGSTGAVKSFNSLDIPVTVSTQPKVSQEAAEGAARGALATVPPDATAEAVLLVGTNPPGDPSGKQALVWVVSFGVTGSMGEAHGALAYVDAQQGTVLSVVSVS